MGKTSRRKGKGYEQKIARVFRACGWPDAKRHLEVQKEEAEEGRDLDGTFPFAVQCKNWKKTPSISAIEEVVETDEYPVRLGVLKRTRGKGKSELEVVVVDLPVFMEMVARLNELGLLEECVLADDIREQETDGAGHRVEEDT